MARENSEPTSRPSYTNALETLSARLQTVEFTVVRLEERIPKDLQFKLTEIDKALGMLRERVDGNIGPMTLDMRQKLDAIGKDLAQVASLVASMCSREEAVQKLLDERDQRLRDELQDKFGAFRWGSTGLTALLVAIGEVVSRFIPK